MARESEPRVPWDENAALEELERVRRSIEEWRGRRKAVQAEFDRFVRGFRTSAGEGAVREPRVTDAGTESLAGQTGSVAPSAIPVDVAATPLSARAATSRDMGSDDHPAAVSSVVPRDESSRLPLPSRVDTRSTNRRIVQRPLVVFAGVLLAVAGAAVLLTRPWQSARSESPRPSPSTSPARQNPEAIAAPDRQRPAPTDAGPPRSEILAVRRVWVRVVVDGVKTVERELQAGERVSLPAGGTAAIRTGNAGALKLTVNGEDRGTLGTEGDVVTRTIRIPAAPVR